MDVGAGAPLNARHGWAAVAVPRSFVFYAVLGANALPLAASVLRSAFDHYVPASDWALTELSVRAVGTRATPLVGAWSRYGWRHPGPLPFYLLAVAYRFTGSAPFGIQLGAILINGSASFAILLVLRRRGRLSLIAGGLGLLVLQYGLWANHLRNEWNVALPVIPFVLLVVAAWDANSGSRLSIAVVPIVATFVMQAHVGYVPLAIPSLVAWVIALRRLRRDREVMRAARVASAVAAVAWLPVGIDAALHGGGNILRIISWTTTKHSETARMRTASHLIGDVTSLAFPFARGLHTTIIDTLSPTHMGPAPGALLIVLGGLLIVGWRRFSDFRWLILLLLATWSVGLLATSRIEGPLAPYLLWWALALAMTSCVAAILMLGAMRFVECKFVKDFRGGVFDGTAS